MKDWWTGHYHYDFPVHMLTLWHGNTFNIISTLWGNPLTRCYSISQEICTRFFALLCFVVVIHWLTFPYPSGLLHWHCGNLTIVPVPAKQPWWIWINTSCEFIMNDCITTTKQSTTKPCAYFLGYTVCAWQAVEQTDKVLGIWDAVILMWRKHRCHKSIQRVKNVFLKTFKRCSFVTCF